MLSKRWLLLLCGSICLAHDGQPEHPPKHGGIVFTSGALDVEAVVLKPQGRYQIYFTDAAGEEVPASTASGVELSIRHAAGPPEKIALRIDDSGESWLGVGASADSSIGAATLSYRFRGSTVQTDIPFASVFHAEFQTIPKIAKPGEPVQLIFAIKDFFGKSVRSLQIVHEKPMHLMVVSSDLSEFHHLHPELGPGNVFRVPHVFAHGGDYRLYADFTPIGAGNHIESFALTVQGAARAPVPLDASEKKTSDLGGIRMVLAADRSLRTGQDIGFSMALFDARTGAPIHNLQRYLGAWAHIAIISQDLREFVHVHPIEEPPASAGVPALSPDTIRTVTGFRRPGLYKMWVQVQRENTVTAVPFVFRITPGNGPATPVTQVPSGALLIKVSSAGYEPARILAKAGQPIKLAFFRPDAQNCGREVIFPALGIQRELPPGQTVVIDITPRKTGSLSFSCGMKMLHGELVIQ
jgi:hypothetical protein